MLGESNMPHRIKSVEAKENYIIEAIFFDGYLVHYDVKQLFDVFPVFRIFEEDQILFRSVKVDQGGYGVSWNDKLDLDAETIWENGVLIETQKEKDINHLLAYRMIMARKKAGVTQKELAEKTGIYQADISKIERGLGNPSLSTLNRLAEGLGMELRIDFFSE